MTVDGILLVDKPIGWTSFDVVAKVRNTLKKESGRKVKVGHTGTLDPLATGLLVIVVGSYCKRADEFSKLDKTYEVTMNLGQTSTTGDEEGEKVSSSSKIVDRQELQKALKSFVGESMQTPPAFSAIKVNGQRAYKLARAGHEVNIEPRKILINSLQLTSYEYPKVKFTADVGSGTYVRSLVQDIGEKLETGAYMSDLRRTQIGQFMLTSGVNTPDKLDLNQIIQA